MNRTTFFLVPVLALALLTGCEATAQQAARTLPAPTNTTTSIGTATTTVSAAAGEEAAIREAIVDVLGDDFVFDIARFKVVGPWAGALVVPTDPHLEGGAFLLYREGTGWWRVVDFGRGYSPEEWMAGGAPRELAEWF